MQALDESIALIRDQYGLDDPFYEQYWRYLQTLGSGDLGTSIVSRRSGSFSTTSMTARIFCSTVRLRKTEASWGR